MDVLVVNAGSTSLKLAVVGEHDDARSLAALGEGRAHAPAAVGHRVVHGGPGLRVPVVINEAVKREIRAATALAPLHNEPALRAIDAAEDALPDVPHVAVFDTAFHATIPPAAATYAVPTRWREEWGIRRYGFHGLSVESVAERVRVPRLVVCHLGGGCSVTAVLDGRSVDTTMGFSPLEGVPMATRSGSVDPGALLYLLREGKLGLEELDAELERESGLAGLSDGGSGDIRHASALAVDVFVLRVAGAVAAMATSLGGLDVVAFTGGIGEHAADVRDRIVDRVRFLGDFAVEVVPAREDVVVARAVRRLLRGGGLQEGGDR